MIALTFSNNKSKLQLGATESSTFCRSCKLTRAIHSFLGNTLKLDLELMKSLPIVQAGHKRPVFVLPNGGNWLSELWKAYNNVARVSTYFRLNRLKKDGEQPGWCLKKTWETFKEYCPRADEIFGVSQVFRNWRNNEHNRRADM